MAKEHLLLRCPHPGSLKSLEDVVPEITATIRGEVDGVAEKYRTGMRD
ncbi:unnamed protein product [[Actinomadura] parvosata subsp. kistnae]|nr:unnamed protein product [Actinomadura parvosata subsp. kistnae]